MDTLPPLECLRYFEAAARRESFARAARELGVTASAVAHRIRALEAHLRAPLFERRKRGVRLNPRGRAYLEDVRQILSAIRGASERHRRGAGKRSLRIVSLEGFAEAWLLPRLIRFRAAHPDIAVHVETGYASVDPAGPDFDCWLTHRVVDGPELHTIPKSCERTVLFDEPLLPFSAPALLAERGSPASPARLLDWPLLYHLGWPKDWPYWFARNGAPAPDLLLSSGFRVFGMIVRAAVEGLGVALACPSIVASELERGALVPVLERGAVPMRSCLYVRETVREHRDVEAFRTWLVRSV